MHSEKITAISGDTPIFKYFSIEGFYFLLFYKKLMFSKLSTWPDAFEGARFNFFKKIKSDDKYSAKSMNNFFGCPWTLQTEESVLYQNSDEHKKSEEELYESGSASMWETYCKNGGVRIKTTINKVKDLVSKTDNNCTLHNDKVTYEPSGYWGKSIKSPDLISMLFVKRVSFRHESEYRFIIVTEEETLENQIFIKIDDLFGFVDEFLISPATPNNVWISRMLYHYAASITNKPEIIGTNRKWGNQYCKISNLYGNISHNL